MTTQFTIAGVRVFTGAGLTGPCHVVIDGAAIAGVRPAGAAAAHDGEAIDGTGKTLLPGLIDTHVHLENRDNLHVAVRHGVTTMIDLGTSPASLVDSLRGQPGLSDIRSAGSAASAPGSIQSTVLGFPAESVVHGPDDAERYLRWITAQGADLIKIIVEDPQLPGAKALDPATVAALVTGARARNLQTVAHATRSAAYHTAADAGVDILTHVPTDQPPSDTLIAQLLRQKTVVSPTLIMMKTALEARRAGATGPGTGGPGGPQPSFEICLETVRRLHAAGVPIVAGTDAHTYPKVPFQLPHGSSLHDELTLLVDAGLTPPEALHAATAAAAGHLRLTDRGTIGPGNRADLILLDSDPTTDIRRSATISNVWVQGRPAV